VRRCKYFARKVEMLRARVSWSNLWGLSRGLWLWWCCRVDCKPWWRWGRGMWGLVAVGCSGWCHRETVVRRMAGGGGSEGGSVGLLP
jgi:hypothetical protein